MRVLVVDDDPDCLGLLEQVLVSAEYEVVTAPDGVNALVSLAGSLPDIVLLDVDMPGIGGIEVCSRLRRELGQPMLPVIMVTAHTDTDTRIRGKEAGADEYLSKPFDRRELLARMASLLEKKCLFDERGNEVETLRDQLLQADRLATLGTLAGCVGHELNNIAVVLGSAVGELATLNSGLAKDVLDDLSVVRDHVTAHGRTLLNLGRPGTGSVEDVDLLATVSSVVEMFARSGRARFLDVRIRAAKDVTRVRANPTRLEQVLVNLLVNAADALSESRRPNPRILVTVCRRPDGRVVCAVRDNAGGIPAHVLPRIFESYFTTKPADRGTGLGLPVVRQVVERLGGQLVVDTTPGKGTTFTFDLPSSKEPDQSIQMRA